MVLLMEHLTTSPAIPTVTATSWDHLVDLLYDESWNEDLGRFRSRYAFRGLSDANYRLETTLMRLGGSYAPLERHLLRNFKKYAHQRVVEQDSLWHWLSVAQHFGLPTRLLDWTYSPFVAMHFATVGVDHYQRDAAIWVVNYQKTHTLLPERLKKMLDTEGANVLTTDMLNHAFPSFDSLAAPPETVAMFFEPPSLDDRIVNQFALCSTMSDPCISFDTWLAACPGLGHKVIIPQGLLWEVRDKLDQANITERVLFPGLDGLSRWLKRHYSPRLTAQHTQMPHLFG